MYLRINILLKIQKVERAKKELKAFQKVRVPVGKQITATLEILCKDLAFYDESISDWHLEKGAYQIYVGNASNNIATTLEVELK